MSKSLHYSLKDVHYDNAKFRHRCFFKVLDIPISISLDLTLTELCFRFLSFSFFVGDELEFVILNLKLL